MKKLLLLGIATVALMAAVPAQAAQTLFGECGVVLVPNAATLPAQSLSLAVDYLDTEDFQVPIRVEYGVINGLEVGVMYNYVDIDGASDFGANIKYALPLQLVENLGIAVGGRYERFEYDDEIDGISGGFESDLLQFYGAASFDPQLEGVALKLTAGANYTRVSEDLTGDLKDMADFLGIDSSDTESGVHLFAGVEAGFMEQFAVAAEFETKDSDLETDALTSFAVRYVGIPNFMLQAGITNLHAEDHEFFVGGQYAFSFAQ